MRKLYFLPLCPFSRKVRLVLAEKKLDVSFIHEPVWQKRPEFLALNPAGQVPVLIDSILTNPRKPPAERVLSHSSAICLYLDEVYPERLFSGTAPLDRAEIKRLEAWADEKFFLEVSGPILFEKYFKRLIGLGGPDSTRIRNALTAIETHMAYFNTLAHSRKWLAGNSLSLADFSLVGHLSVLDYFGNVPWEKYPDIKDWYARLKSRPSFRPFLSDRLPGIHPVPHYENLDF